MQRFAEIAVLSLVLLLAGCELEQQQTKRLLLVVSKARNQLLILDRESGRQVGSVATGVGPHQVAAHGESGRAVVTNYGTVENRGSSLTVVDLRRGRASATIDLGRFRQPHGVTFLKDSDRILVTAIASRALLRVNLASGEVEETIALRQRGAHQIVTSPDETRAYVANLDSGSVTAVDLERGRTIKTIRLGDVVEGIALSPSGDRLWAADPERDLLSIIDTELLEVVTTVASPLFPVRLLFAPAGDRVLVSRARSHEVAVIDVDDPTTQRVVAMVFEEEETTGEESRFELRPVPVEMALSPDMPRLFVANANADMVAVIDLETLEIVRWISGGREPEGIAAVNVD